MDDIQKIVIEKIGEQPECVNGRDFLKTYLESFLSNYELQRNLILNAYDKGVIERLESSSDVTLQAIQLIKTLSDKYGLTKDSAVWAVVTWCFILKKDTVARAIEMIVQPFNCNSCIQATNEVFKLKSGIYKPGIDFEAGEICVVNLTENDHLSPFGISWGIGKDPAKIRSEANSHFFHDRVYLKIKSDEYLKIDGRNSTVVAVQKVGDI